MCWARQGAISLAIGLDLKNQILGLVWHAWAGALLEGQGEQEVARGEGHALVRALAVLGALVGLPRVLSKLCAVTRACAVSSRIHLEIRPFT